jgi:GH43 family beta-xylosidase
MAFTNPIRSNLADPYIYYHDNKYYLMGTDGSSTLRIYAAGTIEGLSTTGGTAVYNAGAFYESPELRWDSVGQKWYIYYTRFTGGQNTIFVLQSNSTDPLGTYHLQGTLSTVNYDATIFQHNGQLYMLSSDFSHITIQKMPNYYSVTGPVVRLFGQTQTWETQIIEAPQVVVNPSGTLFLLYSSGTYNSAGYAEGGAIYTGGDPMSAGSWSKLAGPLFKGTSSNGNFGTATCSPFQSPDGVQYWFVYGGYSSANYNQPRNTRVQQMSWQANGYPNLGTPLPLGTVIAGPNVDQPLTSTASSTDGLMRTFYRGNDNALWCIPQLTANGSWGSHIRLGTSDLYMDSAPAATVNANGAIDVFFRGRDGALWHVYEITPNGTWSSETRLGSPTCYLASVPRVGQDADGRLEVFFLGGDSGLWHIYQKSPNNGEWSSEIRVGTTCHGDPGIGYNADGRLEVWFRNSDNSVWHYTQSAVNSETFTLAKLSGGSCGLPIALGFNADGRAESIYRGTDGKLWTYYQTNLNSSFWKGPSTLPASIKGSPATALTIDGRMEAIYRGPDYTLKHSYQAYPNGGWVGPYSIGGLMLSGVSVGYNADRRAQVFYCGDDGTVMTSFQTSTTSTNWSTPQSLGGGLSIPPYQ